MANETGAKLNDAAYVMNEKIKKANQEFDANIPLLKSGEGGFSQGGIDNASLEATEQAIASLNADTDAFAPRGVQRPLTISDTMNAAIRAIGNADTQRDQAINERLNWSLSDENHVTGVSWTRDDLISHYSEAANKYLNGDMLSKFREG
jgi:hypothetical protein